ncbi:tetratricopeptide repeat protein [Candidatus Chlorohelix sp.]|uniref:tetratricopeptide repeat protein n=1 Tax=Candidatus Chlorohelix sp. TaxID=3139201 RepID=UPI00305D65DA
MQLYQLTKRKGFALVATLVMALALTIAFSDIFNWVNFPRNPAFFLFRTFIAAVVLMVWLVLNLPPPKLPIGKFIIALAEFSQETEPDGGYIGILRPERIRRLPFGRFSEPVHFEDESLPFEESLHGSHFLDNLRQKRRAQPVAALQGEKQSAALPESFARNGLNTTASTALATRPNRNTTQSAAAVTRFVSGVSTTSSLVATNEIGEPQQEGKTRQKFIRPDYLDRWMHVSGARQISAFLVEGIGRAISQSGVDDLAIFKTAYADDSVTAKQHAELNRAHVVIWGWNTYHTRREFVPVFEILASLEDAPPPAGDMQIMCLSSFELGLHSAHHSASFNAFVSGLGAYGLRKFEQARNEFSLALIANIMSEVYPRYENPVARAIIYFFLGNAYYYCNQLEKALRCYQEAWALDSQLFEARVNMGVALALQGKLDFSVKSFIGVVRDNPELAIARYNLGMAYLEKGDFGKCRRELGNAIKINPRYAVAFRGLGISYFKELQLSEQNRADNKALPSPKQDNSDNHLLYEEAITRIGDALRLKPDYARARVDLGRIRLHQAQSDLYESEKCYHQASAELQEALRIDHTLVEAHYMLGLLLREQQDLESAVLSLKEAVRQSRTERDPFYALAHYAQGEIYQQRGQVELAKEEFKEATRARAALSPATAQDYINQGIGNLGNQQFAEAREAFQKALQLEPDNAEAMLYMGVVYQETNLLNQAFTIYQNVMKLPNAPEEVYNRLSRLYLELGDEKNAFDIIKNAAARNPRSARLQFWLGNAYRRSKDESQAMSCYINAFRIDPDSADARFNLAMIYLGRKQIQDAVLQFTEVVRIRPHDYSAYIFLGRVYLQMGQTQEAVNTLNNAIRIKPDAVEALLALGQIYQRQAEAELAIAQYETALTYSPNDLRIRELLASAYALAGRVELSIEQFQAVLSSEPSVEQKADAHYNLGVAYTSRENYHLAAQEFVEYVKLKPNDADGYFNLGLAYKNQSMIMEAIDALSKAIELRSTYATAYQLRGQLFIAINDNEHGIADLQAFQRLKVKQ